MRSADALDQARLELLEAARGRPVDSPGWGMVQCVKTGELKSRDGKEVCRVTAGTTRCEVGYWAVRDWPAYFQPIDKRDTRTIGAHRRNLERAKRERSGRTATRRHAGVLPSPSSAALRLPRATNRPAPALP
jgi:hypothetical protein